MNYSNLDCRLPRKVVFTPKQMRDLRHRILRKLEAERVAERLKNRVNPSSTSTSPR